MLVIKIREERDLKSSREHDGQARRPSGWVTSVGNPEGWGWGGGPVDRGRGPGRRPPQ